MMFWYGNTTGWGWVLLTISMVVFWGLVITGVVVLIRFLSGAPQPASPCPPPTAEQLLAERFARGDIEASDYSKRLATLRGQGRTIMAQPPTPPRR